MNQKTLFLSLIIMASLMYSCKKDNDVEPTSDDQTEVYPNYSMLSVGNYWVYQQFDIDSSGTATSTSTYDSCYVEKDTIINSKTYFKVVKPRAYFPAEVEISFLRDSLDCIVNSNGKVLFSSENYSNNLWSSYFLAQPNDTVCQIILKMADINMPVTVPLGTYTTMNAKETYLMYPNWSSAGNTRIRNFKYAENIGLVVETLPFFASLPNYVERRLIRYHVN